ncbi:uncharacterized protein C8R40DRAFT_1075270 [Lentinula edodes]|uniref:uncharacterized protein n=1 Tax=Lentinula edodes TaxID=5353 RepID=UPI001E8D0043|nr:uncharacterized protein C8R40DRAFT_1075270 [Lentinula edodes]KAH7867859.1 hypothetical protein C8R40DRAFT_1075270 [Lentinula edodes]
MPTALLLPKVRDLDLSNVETTPHVEPRIASLLPPTTLEDVHPQAQSPGTYPPGHIPSRELTTSRPTSIHNLFESYIDVLASTTPTTQYHKVPYFYLTSLRLRDLPGPPRNPLKGHPSSPQPLLAPFELQPAPSTLQHKPSYTKSYLKAYSDPGLTGAGQFRLVFTALRKDQLHPLPVPRIPSQLSLHQEASEIQIAGTYVATRKAQGLELYDDTSHSHWLFVAQTLPISFSH